VLMEKTQNVLMAINLLVLKGEANLPVLMGTPQLVLMVQLPKDLEVHSVMMEVPLPALMETNLPVLMELRRGPVPMEANPPVQTMPGLPVLMDLFL